MVLMNPRLMIDFFKKGKILEQKKKKKKKKVNYITFFELKERARGDRADNAEREQYGVEPDLPVNFSVFYWHEETFNLPQGSTLVVLG